MQYILLLIGFVVLIKGADVFISGSSSVAKKFGIPDLVIGLTIVAMGTSAPELAVSMVASVHGNNAMAISNVVGSNIFNVMVILGVCAIITPIVLDKIILKQQFIFSTIATFVLLFFISDSYLGDTRGNTLTRSEGLILVTAFCIYMYFILRYSATSMKKRKQIEENRIKLKEELDERNTHIEGAVSQIKPNTSFLFTLVQETNKIKEQNAKGVDVKGKEEDVIALTLSKIAQNEIDKNNEEKVDIIEVEVEDDSSEDIKERGFALSIIFTLLGVIAVCVGGEMVVTYASKIAETFGISDTVIGLTIVGVGTSLPELVTSVIATKNGNPQLALGNVIGSSIFNVLFTLGLSAVIMPMSISGEAIIDAFILTMFSLVVLVFSIYNKGINKVMGSLMLVSYAGFMVYILNR